jgi:hypothetical protein
MVADGAGDFVVAWEDGRNGGDFDVYAQRLNGSGATLWTPGGIPVAALPLEQRSPELAAGPSGDVVIVWQDARNGMDFDLYAQRIGAGGAPQWAADGIALSTTSGDQVKPRLVGNGSGGAVVVWMSSTGNLDVFAQGITSSGRQ